MCSATGMANPAALSLLSPEPLQGPIIPVFPFASSSSSFFVGGTHLSPHRKFISVSVSSSPSQFNPRISARRFGRLIVAAAADYYSTLGVSKSATNKEIKTAYRRLARQVLYKLSLFQANFEALTF